MTSGRLVHFDVSVTRTVFQVIVSPLVTSRAGTSVTGKTKNNLGWTPLHLATYFGHLNVVELLLRAGCDVNSVNDVGDTGLHKAAFVGREVSGEITSPPEKIQKISEK